MAAMFTMPKAFDSRKSLTAALALSAVLASTTANAYVGPGLGLGAIGAVLGTVAAIFLALFSIAYYPVKRFLKKRKSKSAQDEPGSPSDNED